ncbi:MAG: hypothetical protein IJH50_07980 [Kiritimatiellae bacterium]|nr:hypothetical protein [Kiritimatiellia bacterium]
MKILGNPIFAHDAEGRLLSRIGTMFFRTPGLVTKKGVHAMQRLMWIEEINAGREAAGQPPLTMAEEEAEVAESVDLIFTESLVLIRPNPDRMDLALRADEELQQLVSKRVIRFLNTSSAKVRAALRERGENWRMARQPISQDDMANLIKASKVPVGEHPIYYYNQLSGTRFITAGTYNEIEGLPADAFRRQIVEIVAGLKARNRTGHPEVDLFPSSTPIGVKTALKGLKPDEMDDAELKEFCRNVSLEWRMALPAELREETCENFEWRNTMCHALTRGPNETAAEEQELIAGIAPEFYRQIEWLPGARIDGGEVIFDAIYDEAARTQDPELLAMCDNRVKSFLFNTTRLFGRLDYINIGRIVRSLARHPKSGNRRGNVYIMQYREAGAAEAKVMMIRLQKWGVAERLDEGKSLLQAIIETDEYSDYILDRRLMCRQLGMNLPRRLGYGHFTEKYRGNNQYNGVAVRTAYFIRTYVPGIASDKIPPAKFRNPAFALRFAELMGTAAALDMVVGRRSSSTRELMFDQNYEVVRLGADGLPAELMVTDHAGSFTEYERDLADMVADYASPVLRRRSFVADFNAFAEAYVAGFRRRLAETQAAYRARRKAFDGLFVDRPYDTNGSGAYRWACALRRLDACDPDRLAARLHEAIFAV